VIQPLANRVLIKPDPPPDETASGLIIPDNAHASKDFEMSGTVIASAHRVREAMIARFQKLLDNFPQVLMSEPLQREARAVVALLRVGVRNLGEELSDLSEIAVGDHVAFPYTAGTVLIVDGERHLLMNEDQIVAILDREVAA
jgi:co-chaperonin GroES (HSP10)